MALSAFAVSSQVETQAVAPTNRQNRGDPPATIGRSSMEFGLNYAPTHYNASIINVARRLSASGSSA